MKKLGKMFALFTVIVLSHGVFAQNELQFPAEISLKNHDIKKALQKSIPELIGAGGALAPRWELTEPYKTEIENINWSGDIDIHWEESQGNSVRFIGQIVSPVITIDSIKIHDTITRRIGGVDVVIRVDAECGGLKLYSPQAWGISGNIGWSVENSKLKTHVLDLDFATSSEWTVEVGECVGPRGIEDVLAQAFKDFVKDEDRTNELIFNEISKFIQSQSSKLEDSLFQDMSMGIVDGVIANWQTFEILGNDNGDIKLFGLARLVAEENGDSAIPYSKAIPYKKIESFGVVRERSGLVFSNEVLPPLTNFIAKSGLMDFKVSSKSIPGLDWLLSSRLVQFFVWPDLWNFPRGVELLFKNKFVGDIQTPTVRKLKSGFSFRIKTAAKVMVEAPYRNKMTPYLDVHSALDGSVAVQTYQDKIRFSFDVPKLPFQLSWRREFAILRSINRWISSSIIGSRILSSIQDSSFEVDRKVWTIGELLKVQISEVSIDRDNILIHFQNK